MSPEDAASELWPVIVGGRFADVVEAFRKYGERVAAAERETCAKALDTMADERLSGHVAEALHEVATAFRARK